MTDPDREALYLEHRGLVVRLAYDITGSWADAEDVAQQTYLRFVEASAEPQHPRAYLARIATNLALDAVTRRQRVVYVGPDLPEPVATGPGADEAVAEADEVEIALMVVLRSLTPYERAVFLLHDVFGFTHAEIASMLGREAASVRQANHRARGHVQARRPLTQVTEEALMELTGRFLAAAQRGDVEALVGMLAQDARFVGDGGGKAASALKPVVSAEKVARLMVGLASRVGPDTRLEPMRANGRPALMIWFGDVLDQVLWLLLDESGRVAEILTVRNPDKLGAVSAASA